MKKVLLSAVALVASLAITHELEAQKAKRPAKRVETSSSMLKAKGLVHISGTLPDDKFDGDSIALVRSGENGLDTLALAAIKSARFTFAKPIPQDTVSVVDLRLKRKYRTAVILEAGEIVADLDKQVSSGTPLNEKYTVIKESGQSITEEINGKMKTADKELSTALFEEYKKRQLDLYVPALKVNPNNALGTRILNTLLNGSLDPTDEQISEWRGLAGKNVLENPAIVSRLKLYDAAKATSAGMPYIDIEGINDNKETSKLSDFVGTGHYTLVDFWASWCGPCRRAMPGLKKIYETYGAKGLQIVGIAVWDEWDDHLQAVAKDALPWPQIFNKQATEPYGIMGIPQIMLISPDGKIVARDLHGEEMITKLLDAELAKNGDKL